MWRPMLKAYSQARNSNPVDAADVGFANSKKIKTYTLICNCNVM